MKNALKRSLSVVLVVVILLAIIPSGIVTAKAASGTTYDDMLSRAKALVNYEWTPSKRIYTWNDNYYNGKNYFEAGEKVKGVPYTLFTSEVVSRSQCSLSDYKKVASSNYSTTKYCSSIGASRIGPVYGTCCATFVAEVFGGSFVNSSGHPVTYNVRGIKDKGNTKYNVLAKNIVPGDAVSDTNGDHIVWVGAVTSSSITIYECTPPISQKVVLSKSSDVNSSGYLVYGDKVYSVVTKSPEFSNTHTHSYSTNYEAAHPHRVYKKCSCDDWYYTGATKELKTCSSCWHATFNVSNTSLSLEVGETKTLSFTLSGCYPDSRKVYYSSNKSLAEVKPDGSALVITGIAPGSFNLKLSIYSDDTKSTLINSISIPITITTTEYTGKVSFDKSSISLVIPTKTSDTLTINLSGYWPEGAGYLFEYDEDIVSLSQNKTELTLSALNEGRTKFYMNVVDKNNGNSLITYACCEIIVSKETYDIRFDANGGTGAPAPQTKTHGEDLIISTQIPQKTGYIFTNWSSGTNGSGFTAIPGKPYRIDNDILWYAQYDPIQYTVKYNANGGYGATISSTSHTYDEEKNLPTSYFSKAGYIFLGWSTNPNATVPTYVSGQSVKNISTIDGSTVTLYAVWKEGRYGDVNNDGIIDIDDVDKINSVRTGNTSGTVWVNVFGDVNGDGVLDYDDILSLNRVRTGKTNLLPVDTMDKELKVTTSAKKTQYFLGDTISTDGVVISLYYPETDVSYDVTSLCKFDVPSTNSAGSQSVYANFNGLSTKYSVTVTQPSVTLSASSKTITNGNTATITATTNPSGQSVTWTSSNTSVATVTNGNITAKTTGSATITAKFVYNGITYSKTCSVTVAEPAHTHTAGSWIVDKKATCTVNGSKHKECTSCGKTIETAVIYATGHTTVKDAAIAATCTTSGKTEGSHCSVCNTVIKAQTTIAAKGHTAVKDPAIAATCTKAGKTEGSHCSVCNTVIKAQTTVPAKGHIASSWIIDKYATNNEAGSKHKECTVCGKVLETTTIPALKPATPKVNAVNTLTGMNVTWNAVDGAVKYALYKRLGTANSWTYVTTIIGTSYADNNTPSVGSYYVYTVKAYNSAGVSSDYLRANCASVQRVVAPYTKAANAVNGINVTWGKVAGASKYVILRRIGTESTWKILGETTGTSFLDKNVTPGIYYIYSIRAVNNTGYSAYDINKRFTIQRILTPIATATNLINGVQINWNAVISAKKYNIYRRVGGSSTWTLVGTTTGTSIVDKNVVLGKYYVYSIRAINGTGYSAYNSACTDTIQPITAPTTKAVNKSNGVQITWNAVTGAKKYNVYRRLGGTTNYILLGSTTGTSFFDKSTSAYDSYAYSIRAINGTGYSAYNVSKCAVIKATKVKVTFSSEIGEINGKTYAIRCVGKHAGSPCYCGAGSYDGLGVSSSSTIISALPKKLKPDSRAFGSFCYYDGYVYYVVTDVGTGPIDRSLYRCKPDWTGVELLADFKYNWDGDNDYTKDVEKDFVIVNNILYINYDGYSIDLATKKCAMRTYPNFNSYYNQGSGKSLYVCDDVLFAMDTQNNQIYMVQDGSKKILASGFTYETDIDGGYANGYLYYSLVNGQYAELRRVNISTGKIEYVHKGNFGGGYGPYFCF